MYSIIKDGVVVATSDTVPNDTDLTVRGEYAIAREGTIGQLWDGTVLSDPPAPEPTIPMSASKLRIYQELVILGEWTNVDTALQADQNMLNEWNFASQIDRNYALVDQMKTLLGWTDQQVDDLFVAAQ